MMKYMFTLFLTAVIASACLANSPPTVTDVSVSPRADGSGIVELSTPLAMPMVMFA